MSAIDDEITDARNVLEAAGYAVLKASSVRRIHERRRIAEVLLEAEKDRRAETHEWAVSAFTEQRRLADRLTFVYGVARAHGATVDELRGDQS